MINSICTYNDDMVNVLDSASKALTLDKFVALNEMDTSCMFYGTVLRSEFDVERIGINKKFHPQRFYAIEKNNKNYGIIYLYGSFLQPKNKYKDLTTNLDSFYHLPQTHTEANYKKILSIYGLSCNETYRYFSQGVYPIDSACRTEVFSNKINFNEYFKGNTEYPFFLTIVSPIIFYFSNAGQNILDFKNYLQSNTKL